MTDMFGPLLAFIRWMEVSWKSKRLPRWGPNQWKWLC